jgi:predicted GNAT family acetyltransferase
VEVVELADPVEFLERARELLLADEARHNLILGLAGTLRDSPEFYREHKLWLVTDAGEAVGAALRTPPHNLVLARPRAPAAQQALASTIAGPLPGVTAALPEAESFADAWQAKTGTRRRLRISQRIYALEQVRSVEDVPGAPREATDADRPLLRLWLRHFGIEALREEQNEERTERLLDHRLGSESAGFVLWEDGLPVSLAGFGGETPNGVRIGPVYTPPVLRSRGYGSAVTAAVSAERLAAGRRFCFLYTDAANPTSNKIYTEIGYEPVCDAVDYAFE